MNIHILVLNEKPKEHEAFIVMESPYGDLPENVRIEYMHSELSVNGYKDNPPKKCFLSKSGLYFAVDNCWKIVISKI